MPFSPSHPADSWVTDAEIQQAAEQLLRGELVAFPTETVYGLGADAENVEAIEKIYTVKQRPGNHPLIVHLPPDANIDYWTTDLTPEARALMQAFWPGPLTLIVTRAAHIPPTVSGGQVTLGLRCPSHPVAQKLLSQFSRLKRNGNGGLAAPSANRFGHVSPTLASHVRSEFSTLDDNQLMILDGGAAAVGIESTIVDVSRSDRRPSLLRPGHIRAQEIETVLNQPLQLPDQLSPQVSGSLKAHYAPTTPLALYRSAALPSVLADLAQTRQEQPPSQVAALVFDISRYPNTPGVEFYEAASDPTAYAQALYQQIRTLDESGYSLIVIEQPPLTIEWQAVNDRLRRAAAAFA